MSISATAPATAPATTAGETTAAAGETTAAVTKARAPRYPHVPAVAGNANVRAFLGQGLHPASGRPLADALGANCGNCLLAYRIQVSGREGTGTSERLKCSKAPISRRGRQGIDLRPATSDQPATPACILHCTFADWPCDPDGRYDTGAGQIGTGRDHADQWGVHAVYRIFGIDLEHQCVWVEFEAEMVPDAAAPTGYVARPPRYSRPDQPHLYRFWIDLAVLHTVRLTHAADTGPCTHELVRGGRRLTAPAFGG